MGLIESTPWYRDAITLATFVMAGATVIYAIFSVKLWQATRRSADISQQLADTTQKIFEAANRPYVGVYEVNLEPVRNGVHIEIKIKNSGTVTASNILIEVNSFHNGEPFRSIPAETYPDVLIPGAEFMKDIVTRRDSFDRALAQGEQITVGIRIEYTGLTDIRYGSDSVFAFTPEINTFTGKGRREYIVA